MAKDEGPPVGQQAIGTILMDGIPGLEHLPIPGIDGAKAVADLLPYPIDPLVVETEMGASAEVAVQSLHLVTLFPLGIEEAEVRLLLLHSIVVERVEEFLVGKFPEGFHDPAMAPGEGFMPLPISHSILSLRSVLLS